MQRPGQRRPGGFAGPTARSYPTPGDRMQIVPAKGDGGGGFADSGRLSNAPPPLPAAVGGGALLRGFTQAFPSVAIQPYFKAFGQAHTAGIGNSTLLADVPVPAASFFVATRVVFRAVDSSAPAGTAGFLGATNPWLLSVAVGFEISPQGALVPPGQFGFAYNGVELYSLFPFINTDVAEALGWTSQPHYACVIQSGGRFQTRVVQIAAFGVVAPTDFACEVGGFFAPSDLVTKYLSDQGSVK